MWNANRGFLISCLVKIHLLLMQSKYWSDSCDPLFETHNVSMFLCKSTPHILTWHAGWNVSRTLWDVLTSRQSRLPCKVSLMWANTRISDNLAILIWIRKAKVSREESVSSPLFNDLVSLWRNRQIACADPGFTAACHPGESLNQVICQPNERFAAPGFTVK